MLNTKPLTQQLTVFSIILFLILFNSGSAGALNKTNFTISELKILTNIDDVLVEDLNADGLKDLLVLHHEYDSENYHYRRYVSFIYQYSYGLSTQTAFTYQLDERDIFIDINASGFSSEMPSLLFLRADGVYQRQCTSSGLDDNYQKILAATSIFWGADSRSLYFYNFSRDLNNTPGEELLIFKPNQLFVFARSDSGDFLLDALYRVPMNFSLQQDSGAEFNPPMSAMLSTISFADFNGDSLKDVGVIWQDRAEVYLANNLPRNIGSINTPDFQFTAGVLTKQERENGLHPVTKLQMRVIECNNDELVDVVVTKMIQDDPFNGLQQTHIFFNKNGEFYPIPDRIFTAQQFIGAAEVADINIDGKMDVIVQKRNYGIINLAKYFINRKISSDVSVFIMKDDDCFDLKPDFKTSISLHVGMEDILSFSPLVNFSGDFNGDGRVDMLAQSGANELSIYFNDDKKLFSKKADVTLPIEVPEKVLLNDLNSDDKSDLICWFKSSSEKKGIIKVFLSQ